ncbi:MAG: VOC family protein [Clostridia bacterium]
MKIQSIEHAGIFALDPKKMAEWYCSILGFQIVFHKNDTYFIKAQDQTMLEICLASAPAQPQEIKTQGIRHLALVTDDFQGAVHWLMLNQVKVLQEPTCSTSGNQTFFFEDLEGNVLHLIHRKEPLAYLQ